MEERERERERESGAYACPCPPDTRYLAHHRFASTSTVTSEREKNIKREKKKTLASMLIADVYLPSAAAFLAALRAAT
jgi:hypothetical protein